VTADGDADNVKPGATFTVSKTVVDCVRLPDVPVMVTVTGPPAVAVDEAVSDSTLDPVIVGLGLKLAVVPAGKPVAANVTPPLKPLVGVTVMLSVLLAP
jgi:hypothetical protein